VASYRHRLLSLVAHFAGGHPDVRLALPDKSVNYSDFFGNADPANNGCSLTSMPASSRSSNQLEQVMAACDHPGSKLKFDEDHRFLREVVYEGLKGLNTGFDSPLIGHFSRADFLVVIDRCELLHVRVIGIEVFASGGDFLEVEISPEDGYADWARRLVQRYQGRSDVTICATFDVPDTLSRRARRPRAIR
jgi:hypothetical protein